ncbi:YbcC family protein [Thiomicrorhabdus sediminis]|uniref:Probable inorganic carbon transporter subunit DabA n=1 Tax=Thiomicrorhabdus sediminis TaxID=2580412 RepID=A0A4P9K3G9_9GAMM|nr:DUF2309 domain-containing protein [Thiomicrorhabdus sediminis]QCU89444.1 DUF2309 domain-containing protein [Thiomicrorhabdus sediminis]
MSNATTQTVNANEVQMTSALTETQLTKLNAACGRIAPTWPLDELIAVNPWWEMRHLHISKVSAKLSALSQAHCLMPKTYFQEIWLESLQPEHLQKAIQVMGVDYTVESLERYLLEEDEYSHWHNVSDFVDSGPDRKYKMAWRDEITHQISQFCADFFRLKAEKASYGETYKGLYQEWLATTRQDKGIEILMAEDGLTENFDDLPDSAEELLAQALHDLNVSETELADYAHALLLDVNGWASWVAYLRWQDRLNGADNNLMLDFLAIRVAWDWVLWQHQKETDRAVFNELKVLWRHQMNMLPELIAAHEASQAKAWVWQRAAEIAYQRNLHQQLVAQDQAAASNEAETAQPLLQAAFCIDVRSEVMRRALETQDNRIETLGFAGFFGLPIEYHPVGTESSRPQLPGLLKSSITVRPVIEGEVQQKTSYALNNKARWTEWGYAPPATFSMVESTGLLYAFKMLRNTLFPNDHAHPINDLPTSDQFELSQNETPLSVEQKVDLAAGILHAMGLDQNLAKTVLLVGHGSSSCNNPHAAGLDCGACGGQTGEINVRVLAFLLNDKEVRAGLQAKGIEIPEDTQFVGAMHNTTTDEFTCYAWQDEDGQVSEWLAGATQLARQERAIRLGLDDIEGDKLHQSIIKRSKDWSQVRPEWGLSNNAAFIIAPRQRTKGLNLDGRSFLHDYDYEQDEDLSLLTLIMTAPMVVTNWINLQYYASVCDNHVYGSGNKVLHNVVDGSIGVFEGNGGDLRIGLPMQSLHNGEQWMHEPLRLSVYIDAPKEAIAEIAAEHEVVRQLIDNEWLYCFHWGRDGAIERYLNRNWRPQQSTGKKPVL